MAQVYQHALTRICTRCNSCLHICQPSLKKFSSVSKNTPRMASLKYPNIIPFLSSSRNISETSVQQPSDCSTDVDNNQQINYTQSKEDFQWVERLLPPSKIPPPPMQKYPTPTGWFPPADKVPDLPYFVRRTRYHEFPVQVQEKRLNLKLTHLDKIDGDIWALEKDICEHLRPHMKYDPATTVHELTRRITIKSDVQGLLEDFLTKNGF